MTEPSNVPPQLSVQFFGKIIEKSSSSSCNPQNSDSWEVTFSQPASDYLDFRRRLDTNNVSLENVILKESEKAVVGTVKVRNIAYQKEVFMRATSDGWKTQEDAFCTYVPNSPSAHGVTVLYDTFSFRLTLPPKSKKLEFCVCFKCSGSEYWDNNSGKNYFILKKEKFSPPPPPPPSSSSSSSSVLQSDLPSSTKINLPRVFTDELKPNAHLQSWSEFASWNHLNSNSPYW